VRNDFIVTLNEISGIIVDCAYKIHTTLGPGLLETVYEAVLEKLMIQRGLRVRRQVPVPISFEGLSFDEGLRADLIVEDCIVVESKSVESIHPVHAKQVLTYCKLLDYRLGLLINFGAALIKDGGELSEDTSHRRSFRQFRNTPADVRHNFFQRIYLQFQRFALDFLHLRRLAQHMLYQISPKPFVLAPTPWSLSRGFMTACSPTRRSWIPGRVGKSLLTILTTCYKGRYRVDTRRHSGFSRPRGLRAGPRGAGW